MPILYLLTFYIGEIFMVSKVEICGIDTSRLPRVTKEESEVLLSKIKAGDNVAKEQFITANIRLVLSIIKRFPNSKVSKDDLFQAGCIGLIKATENFDSKFNVMFSTYAVPMMFVKRNRNTSIGGKFVNEHPREAPYYKKSRYLQGNFAIGEARKP